MKITDVKMLPYETGAHDFATKRGLGIDIDIDTDEKALTRKPFEWKKPVGPGSLWKSNPLMKRPDHCLLPGRANP